MTPKKAKGEGEKTMSEIPGIGKDLRWWHGLTGVSGAALVAVIAANWPNAALIAAGFAGIGIGQWIDHQLESTILPGMIGTRFVRNNTLPGLTFTAAGGVSIVVGIIKGLAG